MEEADKVTGKAALWAQMGAGITGEGKEMERWAAGMQRRLVAAMLASAEAGERGRRWAERQECAPRPPID